ncbi:hypothetical protein [Paenibacillus massiliensis]|uniref:hypothetical protein n=1 Tax=Paenibacillus massiliensis TaxID=225917 RepID=UPI001B7FA1FB|nr:hypothetical protein [Paenibacillus massiliensis]
MSCKSLEVKPGVMSDMASRMTIGMEGRVMYSVIFRSMYDSMYGVMIDGVVVLLI